MCKHRHSNHHTLLFDMQVTVHRVDDHAVTNCMNLTLKKRILVTLGLLVYVIFTEDYFME